MKAKLIKRDTDYCLYNELGETIAASWANVTGKKLLQSNCDEIFGVVDAGKLAEEEIPYSSSTTINVQRMRFIHGFNKEMELNKDKVFTLEDMEKAIDVCIELMNNKGSEFRTHKQTIIQSLQQPTEIDVEIGMEDIIQLKKRAGGLTNMGKPKLDSNGNLILRKL